MDNSINITTEELISAAAELRNLNNSLTEGLKDAAAQMDALENTWNSTASTEIRENMNNMRPRFEEYMQIIESYAAFLVSTATAYEQTESNITSLADQFK